MDADTTYADDENEPQVTSSDPNERKLARRLRINRRWETIKRLTLSTIGDDLRKEQESSLIYSQLQKSADVLERFVIEGEEYITKMRIENDAREVDRREKEGINADKIIQKIRDEITGAQEIFDIIARKWSNIEGYKDPLHIYEDVTSQKEKCNELIKQKDVIIAMLTEEIKAAERNFTKDQRKQNEDINTLAQRIEKQVTFMRRAYRTELQLMENVILTERQAIVEATNKKWEELYKEWEVKEVNKGQKQSEQIKDYQKKMEQLQMAFQEKYREMKFTLGNEIDELREELEKIKTLAFGNSEKLDYNYQILKKRVDENIIIKGQQKRRINKLQDVINGLRKKIDEYETTTICQIKKLKVDIKKMHHSISAVESKADHFAKVNDEKFHKTWEMNRQQVEEILKKIMETDRLLFEQQMGIEWSPPTNFVVDKMVLPSFKSACEKCQMSASSFETTPSLSQCSKVGSTFIARESTMQSLTISDTIGSIQKVEERKAKISRNTIKHVLMKISDRSGFLSEKRLSVLLKPYQYDQRSLVKLDNVFEALNIQGQEIIEVLVSHFYPFTFCHICAHPSVMACTLASAAQCKLSYQMSQISSVFTRFVDDQTINVEELQEGMNAVQIPDDIIEDLVQDLFDPEEFFKERKSLFDQLDYADGAQQQDTDDLYYKRGRFASRQSVSEVLFTCDQSHPLVISSVYVLKALREFVTKFYVSNKGCPTMGERVKRNRNTVSRQVSESDVATYWERYKKNFGENKIRVWNALSEGLTKYLKILKDRKAVCEDVIRLRKQNAELKRLLGNYLEHGEYMKPPCAFREEEICVKANLPHYTNKK